MASNVLLLAFCLFLAIPITAKSRAAKKIEKTEDAEDSALRLDAEDNQVERKKWQLSRQRRFVTGICTTVVGCLGTIIKLFPIRINFRLRAIYNRLKGVKGYTLQEWSELQRLRQRTRIAEESRALMRLNHKAKVKLYKTRIRFLQEKIGRLQDKN